MKSHFSHPNYIIIPRKVQTKYMIITSFSANLVRIPLGNYVRLSFALHNQCALHIYARLHACMRHFCFIVVAQLVKTKAVRFLVDDLL